MAQRSSTYLFWQKYLGHPVQALLAWLLVSIIKLMSFETASNLGARIGRGIGPHTKVHERARINLVAAFPEKSPAEISEILEDMWDNLGRATFEFPLMGDFDTVNDKDRFEFIGEELIEEHKTSGGTPAILWGGHLGNWEMLPHSIAQHGIPLTAVVRMPDNPWVTKLFYKRSGQKNMSVHPKGRIGAKAAMEALRDGGSVGLLVDQKMNDGIAVPFFGRDAMTAPAPAQLAIKYNCKVYPSRLERLGRSARFRVTIHPPMEIVNTGDRKADALTMMTEVNAILEQWIRERPGQWLWPHKRWPQ
jgi:KDO2-lipid IV(A) lauroyltransferase